MGFFDKIFGGGYENPADSAQPYLDKIPGATSQYFKPYIESGRRALPKLEDEYDSLLSNPGGRLNDIGSQFHQSPGFQFALQQALQGAGHAASAGGYAGSPMHEQQNMELATNLGNQDYYNWLQPAVGMYGQGLQGTQGLAAGGLQAGGSMADMIAQTLAQQAQLEYTGQQNENKYNSSRMGNIGKGIGALAAFTPIGGLGGGLVGALGNGLSGFFGG